MATPTGAQKAALEKKALANPNKSDGMRSLLDAGYEVATVRDLFGAPYGFVYGVAVRNGNVTPTARAEAAPKAAKAKAAPAAKAPAKTSATKAAAAKASAKAPARAARPARAAGKSKAAATV